MPAQTPLLGSTMVRQVPVSASTVYYDDSAGDFGGGSLTLQDIIELIAAGTNPDQYLRNTLGGKDVIDPRGTLGATETLDLANGNVFTGTLDQDCTIGFTGWTNGRGCTIRVTLTQDATGGWTPMFTGVSWIGGGTPSFVTSPDTVSHVLLFSDDGGTTIWGALVGSSAGVSEGGMTPFYIPTGQTFVVPQYKQALYAHAITVDGAIVVDGILLPVT